MTKHRTLKAVGFFVVSAAILAFLALPESQAGGGKPIRWKATVLGDSFWGLVDFVGGQDQVNINNGVGTNPTPCNTAGTGSYSYLELQVFNPSLKINIGGFSDSGNPAPAPYGLPNTTAPWPLCIADFLNAYPQPTADYPHIILKFTTCGCGNSITDLMTMPEGVPLPVHMELLFFSHIWDCPANSPFTQETFLNLQMMAHGHPTPRLGGNYDIYIQRVGNVWTAYVDTVFDNGNYPTPPAEYTSADWPLPFYDGILGQYATCSSSTSGKKGKTTWTTTYHYPWAKAPLQFQIAFTKY
jgi:hypothetical protein